MVNKRISQKIVRHCRTAKRYLSKRKNRRKLYKIFLAVLLVWSVWTYFSLPSCKDLIKINPSSTALIDSRIEEAKEMGRDLKIRKNWLPISQIPVSVQRAVLAGEDFGFVDHNGFDTGELWIVIRDIFTKFKLPRGASTITQQLAKNLYLSNEKSPIRKIKEAIITSRLEKHLSKRRILELYLNLIEWGDGVFGVDAAAKFYFGKSVTAVSDSEAAFLAAIIPAPRTTYDPKKNPKGVTIRQSILLRRMHNVPVPSN